ncbi:DUF6281 family protein [Aeromicrobium sp. IC_218]|uniref:DUF6281 family protein n=1 Tax=Aeromicrobium sp. IC_218 TaxID=2545468 RepID=UPI00103DB1D4|nr:DUF6281 family protein [Aeromicrobium sp. IC_218]TCI96975.1 hypothetical protein E0W78_13130 [Aeromicrobium sp. IC_218]
MGRTTLVTAILAALLLGGCSSASRSGCAVEIELDGVRYEGYNAEDVVAGEPLGEGVIVACEDGAGKAEDDPVDLVSVKGGDPAEVIARDGVTDELFLAPGVEPDDLPAGVRKMLGRG